MSKSLLKFLPHLSIASIIMFAGCSNDSPVSLDNVDDELQTNAGTPGTVQGKTHFGYCTRYYGGYNDGAAMLAPTSQSYYVGAMNGYDNTSGLYAGAYIKVKGPSKTINVLITDLLPKNDQKVNGKKGDIDLNIKAFKAATGGKTTGKFQISWEIIPRNDCGNLKYKFRGHKNWFSMQIRDHRWPVKKLEYKNSRNQWINIPKKTHNYFEAGSLGLGPFTFRITDIYNRSITDSNIRLSTGKITNSSKQFK